MSNYSEAKKCLQKASEALYIIKDADDPMIANNRLYVLILQYIMGEKINLLDAFEQYPIFTKDQIIELLQDIRKQDHLSLYQIEKLE
jgi:hypothetical protein